MYADPCLRLSECDLTRFIGSTCGLESPRLHVYTNYLYIRAMRSQAKTVSDTLFKMAEGQQGYFTAKQAADAGYQLGSQAHHVKSGNWVRVERGIYRLARFPQSPEEQLVIYTLWSRNRAGEPEGVYSHQTALSIHELSDVNPARLHMTVPATFRRRAKAPKILVLHRAILDEKDVELRQGFAVTRPLRAIADVTAAESVSREIVEQALAEGRQRGLITAREMWELSRHGQFPKWFDKLLVENKR
jgi:Transcriptional regulator, AbiEi antitoxin